jgi:Leucine-rich repeat (LRR) protein
MSIIVLYWGSLFDHEYETFDEIVNYENIMSLNCYKNDLTELPKLPDRLKYLYCPRNELIKLPDHLPDSLKELDCSRNNIKELPNHLPDSLKKINCARNNIKELPDHLPDSLKELNCYINLLVQLPELPNKLKRLYCNRNPNLTYTNTWLKNNPKFAETIMNCAKLEEPLVKAVR